MATKKTNNLKLVDSNEPEPRKTIWEEKQQDLKITRQELQQRVAALRMELESYRDQLQGAAFDILNDCEPRSLQEKRRFTIDLVERVNPFVAGLSALLDEYPGQDHDSVFDLKQEAAETGFKIGVLAGVILAGSDPKTVDKFTHGLIVDLACHRRLIKEG